MVVHLKITYDEIVKVIQEKYNIRDIYFMKKTHEGDYPLEQFDYVEGVQPKGDSGITLSRRDVK